MVDVDAEYLLELASAGDQDPVEAVAPDRGAPAFRERVRLRGPERVGPNLIGSLPLIEYLGPTRSLTYRGRPSSLVTARQAHVNRSPQDARCGSLQKAAKLGNRRKTWRLANLPSPRTDQLS